MSRDERKAWVKAHGVPDREPRARWLVAPIVGPLIERLSRGRLGWCNATAAGLRAMAFVDTGYVYGEGSIPRFIRREVQARRLLHKRIPPGAHFKKTGFYTANGTQLNRYPSEAERREQLWRLRLERRKQRKEKIRAAELAKEERARREREARRARARGPELVRLPEAPAEPLASPLEQREAIARTLAALGRPMAAATPPRAPETPPPADDWRARVLEQQRRAREFARELGEELDQDDEGDPPAT